MEDTIKRLYALESLCYKPEGTVLKRTDNPLEPWSLELGRLNSPKAVFSANTIEGCVRKAEVAFAKDNEFEGNTYMVSAWGDPVKIAVPAASAKPTKKKPARKKPSAKKVVKKAAMKKVFKKPPTKKAVKRRR